MKHNYCQKLSHLFLLALLLLLFCCSGNKQNNAIITSLDSVHQNQTQIKWICNWQNRESKRNLITSTVKEFEIQHQDVAVLIKYQEEFCGGCKNVGTLIQDTIVSMIQSGKYNWDIIPLTANGYKNIADKLDDKNWGQKYLVNFEDYPWFKESHISQVFEVPEYREDFGGIYAGPMIEGRYYGLWYNAESAKKIGISIKNIGMTFDDMLGYCQKVNEYNKTAKDSDKITFFSAYKAKDQVNDILNNLILSQFSDLNSVPDKKTSLAAVYKSLKAIEELSKNSAINNSVKANVDFISSIQGKVLFTIQVSSWYNQCESEDKVKTLNLIPAQMPVFEKPGPIYHGSFQSVWAVFKNAPHKDQAVELMKYFCTNDVAERWLSTTYNPTGLKVKMKSSDFGQNDIEKFNYSIEHTYGENIKNFDIVKLLFGKENKEKFDATQILDGSVSADEFYKKYFLTL
jgi:ABC-type glycerol-3-phosphate transport system substrate-binding protein